MSSGIALRLRSPSTSSRRATRRPPRPSSPSQRRRTPSTMPRKLTALSGTIDVLHKSSSEPMLPSTGDAAGDSFWSTDSERLLYRPMTCTDVFSPSQPSLSPERTQSIHKVYPEDSKVVVTVTVEGSPGPIRIMLKLRSSVEEAIKLVIDKYGKEGRGPPLEKGAASQYELHYSNFDLEGLDGSSTIGDAGSRAFYLRKRAGDDIATETAAAESKSGWQPCPLLRFLPAYISQKTGELMRRIGMLWKMLGCLHDS